MTVLRIITTKFHYGSRLLILFGVLFLSVSNAAAIPLSDYHSSIELAISGIDSLVDRDEHETDADYEVRFNKTIDGVRATLPKNQQVELEKGAWSTDNTWLHKALDDLQGASVADRPAKLTSVSEALLALENRITELETAQKVEDHKGAAKQQLEAILARPEYAPAAEGPTALTRFLRDFIRWIQSLLPEGRPVTPGRPSFGSYVVMIVVVVLAGLIILYVALLLFKRFKRPATRVKRRKKSEARIVLGERLRPEETASDLLSEAEALARSGDLRAAIRKGYIALLVELGDRNVIALAQHKTNRDYLRSVSSRPQIHSPLKQLTESFERHWYGFAQATPTDWQDFRAGYSEALQTGN